MKLKGPKESSSPRSSLVKYNQIVGLDSMLLTSKVRLNDFRRSAMVSLTTVIPVASTITSVSNLDRNISNALANNIQVILVIDQVSEIKLASSHLYLAEIVTIELPIMKALVFVITLVAQSTNEIEDIFAEAANTVKADA